MSESLDFHSETIHSTATGLVDAAGQVPRSSPLEMSGCGSAAVASAASNFNERAMKMVALLHLQLSDVGGDAQRAADSWDAQEAALAAGAGVGTP